MMERIKESGLFSANKFARITFSAYEDVLGKNGFNSILNRAGLSHFVDNYPPDDLERRFDFADLSSLYQALEDLYGPRGGRGLALRVGRVTFTDFMKNFGALAGFHDPEFKNLSLKTRIEVSLLAASRIFSKMTDQTTTVYETEGEYVWLTHKCPICWGRTNQDKAICFSTIGFLQAMLTGVSGGLEFKVNETKCQAMGEKDCEIMIQKKLNALL
jgi:predicted hydrocarbon binding protein